VTRAAATALAALAALAISACGSEARDLFLVTRSGDVPGARLTLRVTDDGRASCNGKALVDITSAQLITARETERALEKPAKAVTAAKKSTATGAKRTTTSAAKKKTTTSATKPPASTKPAS